MVGLGTDIVEIPRLKQSLDRNGESFLDHVYSEEELAAIPKTPVRRFEYLAGRWAVKEALAKALGCGITDRCRLKEISTVNDAETGAPRTVLSGAAMETACRIGVKRIWTSIAHERDYAVATVVLE